MAPLGLYRLELVHGRNLRYVGLGHQYRLCFVDDHYSSDLRSDDPCPGVLCLLLVVMKRRSICPPCVVGQIVFWGGLSLFLIFKLN